MSTNHDDVRFSADSQHHTVRVGWYEYDRAAGHPDSHETNISPTAALELAVQLVTAAQSAQRRIIQDLAAGDCPVCQNLRLVDHERPNGHVQKIHCPSCRARFDQAMQLIPTPPGWVSEREVLSRGL